MPHHEPTIPPSPPVPAPPTGRHVTARDALICIGVCALLLLAFEGRSIRNSGEQMKTGWERTLVLAVGHPAGAVSDALGLAPVKNKLVAWARSGDDTSGGAGAFTEVAATTAARGVAPVTPDAFDPRALGAPPATPRPLTRLLVTGDSLSMPLDAHVARAFAKAGGDVKVIRDPHIGTGISETQLLDWGSLSAQQVRKDRPDAVVMFMGANEGFPIPVGRRQVQCCGPAWAAAYATRARRMMDTYRQQGTTRVYWLNLPAPRDPARQKISRAVNAAIAVAAQPYRAQVRILDLSQVFTPGGRYRDAMASGGARRIVREADGIHLNDTGAGIALVPVLRALRTDYGGRVPAA